MRIDWPSLLIGLLASLPVGILASVVGNIITKKMEARKQERSPHLNMSVSGGVVTFEGSVSSDKVNLGEISSKLFESVSDVPPSKEQTWSEAWGDAQTGDEGTVLPSQLPTNICEEGAALPGPVTEAPQTETTQGDEHPST